MNIDGRIIILGTFTLFLWGLNAVAQRFSSNPSRIKVHSLVAFLAGSRNQYVIWRTLTFQIGFVANLIFYSLLIMLTGQANLAITGSIALLLILALQLWQPKKEC